MNYAYNIKVNLKNKLYNFYEWDKNDKITILKRVRIYYVDDKTYEDIINLKIIVDNEFLKQINSYNNICIFCNEIDTICVKFNESGIIEKISKLDLEEENEILNEIDNINKTIIKYKITNGDNNYSFNTREQFNIIKELKEYINNIKEDKETLDYLYYEWFKKNKSNTKYEDLIKEINGEFNKKHIDLYNVIKLLV